MKYLLIIGTLALAHANLGAVETPPLVELLNVGKSLLYRTNGLEYAGSALPVRVLTITLKINFPAGEAETAVSDGHLAIIAGGSRHALAEYCGSAISSASFDAETYRRMYGEIRNAELGRCKITQIVVFDCHDLPSEFSIAADGVGPNAHLGSYVFQGIKL